MNLLRRHSVQSDMSSAQRQFGMGYALLRRLLDGVRTPSVAQAGRPPIAVKRLHALVPAYPVGYVSSQLRGPRAWARLACAGRAVFLLQRVGHGLTVRPRRPFNNRRSAAWSPMRLMGLTTVS